MGIWLLSNAGAAVAGADGVGFDLPDMAGWSMGQWLLAAIAVVLELSLLSAVVCRLTRSRQAAVVQARASGVGLRKAARELASLLAYAVLAQAAGYWIAAVAGTAPISLT